MKCEKLRNKYWIDLQNESGDMKGGKFRNKYWMDLQRSSGDISPKVKVAQHGLVSSRIRTLLLMITGTVR